MKQKTLKLITLLLAVIMMVSLVMGCTKSDVPNTDELNNQDGANNQDKANEQEQDEKETQDNSETELFPIEITDTLGRTVTIDQMPEKVISIAPNITEALFALGLGDKVIGVSQQCDYPEEATSKDKMGDFWQPNIELIVAANPDILFVGNAAPQDFFEKMEESDITVVALEGFNLEGTYQSILDTGKVMGAQDSANQLVESMKQKVADIQKKLEGVDKLSSYFVISYGDMGDYTAGAGSFIDEMITLAGGENVAGDMNEPWAEYSVEKLIEKDPEVIFVPIQSGAEGIAEAPGYKELTAIKEGRVVTLDDNLVMRAGPRIVEGLEEMAKGMHPDLFK